MMDKAVVPQIDRSPAAAYSESHEAIPETQTMEQSELEALASRIDQLIERNRQLAAENARLRQAQEEWQQERVQLMQKNDMARHRIEAMISRLRSLEHH